MSKTNTRIGKGLSFKPTTAPTDPENGDIYLDSVSGELMKWNGTVWEVLGEGSSINGKTGDITISAGTNVTIDNTNPNEIIINSTATGGASTLQEAYDNSVPPVIMLDENGPIEIFDPGSAGGKAFVVDTTGGAFEVRDSELSYTGPNVLLNDTSVKGVKHPIEWDNATNRDYVDNRSNANFILNGTSESGADGWMTYADTPASSRPVSGTGGSPSISFLPYAVGPLSGNVSFLLDKPSGNKQGQGVSYDFTIDSASQAKVLKISFDYAVATGTFVAGTNTTDSDVIVYLYDITNARLIEPSSIKLLSNATSPSDTFQSTFQTSPDSVNYRLIFHVATTSSAPWGLKIDNVKVERSQYVYGTPITDWQIYAPTWTASTTNPTIGNGSLTGRWRRVGDSAEVVIATIFGSTTTVGSGQYRWSLPAGLVVSSSLNVNQFIGNSYFFDSSSSANFKSGSALYAVSTNNVGAYNSEGQLASTTTGIDGVGDAIVLEFTVPIAGWSSSVQVSDGYDARPIAGAAYRVTTNQTGVNPNNSQVKIQINGLGVNNLDTVSGFDLTNNRYVVKTSGTYRINAGIELAASNVLAVAYAGRIVINGTTSYAFDLVTPTAVTPFALTGSLTINLVAGDYVELFLYGLGNNSTNTLTVVTGNITNLTLEKVQAPTTISMTETVAVIASNSSGQSIPSGTNTTITNWTKTQDTHNAFNATTGVFTAPYAGFYDFSGIITYSSASSTVNAEHNLSVGVNKLGANFTPTTTAVFVSCSGSRMLYLTGGQQIAIITYQSSGASRTLYNESSFNSISIKMVK